MLDQWQIRNDFSQRLTAKWYDEFVDQDVDRHAITRFVAIAIDVLVEAVNTHFSEMLSEAIERICREMLEKADVQLLERASVLLAQRALDRGKETA